MFESFETHPSQLSTSRHLAGSFAISSALVIGLGFVLSQIGQEVVKQVERQVEVTFVEELPPEPPPPPPPAAARVAPPRAAAPVIPKHLKKVAGNKPPPAKPLEAPVEIEKGPLAEADLSQDKGVMVVGEGEGDPAGLEGGSAGGIAGGTVKADAAPLPEKATAPVPLSSNEPPAYPSVAKEAGLAGTVILKVVIDERGKVEEVQVMRGNEPFVSAATRAVRTWEYEPARMEGKAIRVYRIIKIPFSLRT